MYNTKQCKDQDLYMVIMSEMKKVQVETGRVLIVVEIIEYIPDSVLIKTIIKKSHGNVSAVSFDSGEAFKEKKVPFDSFIQVIDGTVDVIFSGISHFLETGQAIIIPAHTPNILRANDRFKMVSTIIKSGYEELPLIY